jgi:hypothetical protein
MDPIKEVEKTICRPDKLEMLCTHMPVVEAIRFAIKM